jgi:Cu/Ag efflux protein CusF
MKSLFLVAAASVAFAAHAAPDPINVEDTQKMTATVEAVDQAKRTVTLKAANGLSQTVDIGPDVRNFSQIKAGDKVVVQYYEGLAAQLKKKGEGTPVGQVDQTTLGARAPAGAKPGAAVGNVINTTVVIQSVDKATHKVTFDTPDGQRTVAVKKPEAQKFIAGLKKGDEVDITYTEALAISVEPAK